MLSLLSIFFMLATGYIAKRTKVIPQSQLIIFVDFVVIFAIPAMIFDKIYHVNIDLHLFSVIITSFASNLAVMFLAFALGILFKFSKATTASMALLVLLGNTLFVGLPILTGYFGEDIANEVIIYDQIVTCLPAAILSPMVLSYAVPNKTTLIGNVFKVMKFPPFLALVGGILAKCVELPELIFAPIRLLAGAMVPVALFAIGLGLGFGSVRSCVKSTALVLFLGMIISPLIYVGIALLFGIQASPSYMVGLIGSAMPPMVLASAMILKAKLDTNLAISSVALGVCFTFINVPIIFWLYEMFK